MSRGTAKVIHKPTGGCATTKNLKSEMRVIQRYKRRPESLVCVEFIVKKAEESRGTANWDYEHSRNLRGLEVARHCGGG